MKLRESPYFKGHKDYLGMQGSQRLSLPAQSLLIALLCQYNGHNNGSMKITASTLGGRWRSNDLRQKARAELIDEGFLFEVAKGKRPKIASLYAVSCYPLNNNPQHEPELVARFDQDAWRRAAVRDSLTRAAVQTERIIGPPCGLQGKKTLARHTVQAIPPGGPMEAFIGPLGGSYTPNSLTRHTVPFLEVLSVVEGGESVSGAEVR